MKTTMQPAPAAVSENRGEVMSRLRAEVTATGGGLPGRPFRPLNAPNPDGPNRESRRRAKRGTL
jgi:hypothetical protein